MRNTHKDMFVQCYYYWYQGELQVMIFLEVISEGMQNEDKLCSEMMCK